MTPTPTSEIRTLVAVSGFARAGKDTAALQLVARGWTRRAFADPLRAVAYEMNPLLPDGRRYAAVLDEVGYEVAKDTVPGFRDVLIDLGMAARRHISPTVWVDAALRCLSADPLLVLADCRFRNEADAVRDRGGLVIRVERDGVGPANDSPSENELTDYDFDAVIDNNGTAEHLGNALALTLRLRGLDVPFAVQDATQAAA